MGNDAKIPDFINWIITHFLNDI